ncbi:hypothetical protein QJS10_CPB20g00695 [Acorus calamus]|uniref:Uncharacterized protein n=1 Tax=Acorus calamus TaxID=4465 RepID=A0AAV9CBG9_ACOCL|nr:hypothetical protein QJS10_CPB20g00695 [Acorus calamus]
MGDFNITRFVEDQNRAGSITQAMTDFSEWIESEEAKGNPEGLEHRTKEASKQQKKTLAMELKSLDDKEEIAPLSEKDRTRRGTIKQIWEALLGMEEAKWCQRSRETWLKEGNGNTKFFYKVVNHQCKINKIKKMKFRNLETGFFQRLNSVWFPTLLRLSNEDMLGHRTGSTRI